MYRWFVIFHYYYFIFWKMYIEMMLECEKCTQQLGKLVRMSPDRFRVSLKYIEHFKNLSCFLPTIEKTHVIDWLRILLKNRRGICNIHFIF